MTNNTFNKFIYTISVDLKLGLYDNAAYSINLADKCINIHYTHYRNKIP